MSINFSGEEFGRLANKVAELEGYIATMKKNEDWAAKKIKRLHDALIEISKLNTTYHPIGDRFDDGMVGGHQDAVDIAKKALEDGE